MDRRISTLGVRLSAAERATLDRVAASTGIAAGTLMRAGGLRLARELVPAGESEGAEEDVREDTAGGTGARDP